jgi:hypothetical protein
MHLIPFGQAVPGLCERLPFVAASVVAKEGVEGLRLPGVLVGLSRYTPARRWPTNAIIPFQRPNICIKLSLNFANFFSKQNGVSFIKIDKFKKSLSQKTSKSMFYSFLALTFLNLIKFDK